MKRMLTNEEEHLASSGCTAQQAGIQALRHAAAGAIALAAAQRYCAWVGCGDARPPPAELALPGRSAPNSHVQTLFAHQPAATAGGAAAYGHCI